MLPTIYNIPFTFIFVEAHVLGFLKSSYPLQTFPIFPRPASAKSIFPQNNGTKIKLKGKFNDFEVLRKV
jgi:hypothetical protein